MPPTILVIFGITGDLARRKLLPALYHLANDQLLPTPFKIIGITRRGMTVPAVMSAIRESVEATGEVCRPKPLSILKRNLSIITMDITKPGEYAQLKTELDKIEDSLGLCLNRLFYLAIPSPVFGPIVRELGAGHLQDGCQHSRAESRLLIEKPFGYDLVSAQELIKEIAAIFTEKQVYRIDHYLAKETVQNILTFRLQNPLFSSVWNYQHISQIRVVAAESIGIEGRVNFYEQIGALRDVIQSHLLQIVSLITMELPATVTAQTIHTSKLGILKTFKPPPINHLRDLTIRGQYKGYRQEVSQPNSQTETFAALQITSTDPAWKGVPILLQTGKQLATKKTEATVVFKGRGKLAATNQLTIRIQPEEGITLSLQVKQPGFATTTENVAMNFSYGERADIVHADPYERVIADAIRGDKTLFASSDEVLESWRIVQPVLDAWANNQVPIYEYLPGTSGPAAATSLTET